MPIWAMKLGAGLLLAVGLAAGYFAWADHQQGIGEDRATERYEKAISKHRLAAARLLAQETDKVRLVEKEIERWKQKQEVDDERNRKHVENLAARLRDLAGPAGRLRDPRAGTGHGGDAPQGGAAAAACGGDGDTAQTGGLLSAELTGLLRRLTAEADEINMAYISCRADAVAVREIMGR